MTVIQAIENLLDSNEWTPSITGRPNDVPKPVFTKEKEDMKQTLRTRDVARVIDGGDEQHTPQGLGWGHERIEWVVTVELRTADRTVEGTSVDGRHRLFGERGAGSLGSNEVGRWTGLVGETQRILRDNRKGFAEFDIVGAELTVQDQSDLGGPGYYRADVLIPLTRVATEIDTST
jgi:hypothetical protein